jgi:hypothetical protein
MLESELGGAREFVDEFKARLQRRGNKKGQGETETARATSEADVRLAITKANTLRGLHRHTTLSYRERVSISALVHTEREGRLTS